MKESDARDELGISEISTARPVQAALASAASFAVGASMPLLMVLISPSDRLVPFIAIASLGFLGLLGTVGAKAGGADIVKATARVTFWGALAMALTAGSGSFSGQSYRIMPTFVPDFARLNCAYCFY